MSQSIRQMRAIAAGMGISFAELVRRRFQRESKHLVAVIEDGVIRIKPRHYVDPRLKTVKVWNGRGIASTT